MRESLTVMEIFEAQVFWALEGGYPSERLDRYFSQLAFAMLSPWSKDVRIDEYSIIYKSEPAEGEERLPPPPRGYTPSDEDAEKMRQMIAREMLKRKEQAHAGHGP